MQWAARPVVRSLAIAVVVVWLIYGAIALTMWIRPRYRGRRGAILSVTSLVLLVVVLLVVNILVWPQK